MPSLTLDIEHGSELEKKILKACSDRITASRNALQNKYEQWRKAEEKTIAYVPERDVDRIRRAKREGGMPQYTTIQIPYSYSILMASHTYWTTVFLSRTPVFQYTGRHGEGQQNVQAIEAIVDYQVTVGQALVPYYIFLYDVGKYGVGVMGTYWDTQYSMVSRIEEQEDMFLGFIKTGKKKKKKISERILGYQGNRCYNIRPYDFFPDPRVALWEFQKGEFCGVLVRLGWNQIVRRKELGYYMNTEHVRPGQEAPDSTRIEGSHTHELPNSSAFYWGGSKDTGKTLENAISPFYEVYIELIPKDWGLGNSPFPEKWVFTVDTWFKTCIGASPLGAYHDRFPMVVQVFEPEGYSIVPRGMMEILEPVQNTMDWLINSHFYNVRKILNGQFLVDPSRVVMSDMLDPLPGGVIRAKEAAYGTDIRTAVQQLQVVDVTQAHLRDMVVVQQIGERAVGVNDQIMGQMMMGGRRTAQEVRSANTFGISRLKTNAEVFSAQAWTPLGSILVQNSQQYYDQEQMFKIAGDLINTTTPSFMRVTPDMLAGFYDFVPVDGTLPIDRFAQANLWRELMIGLRQMPDIAMEYDIAKLFAYTAQLAGLKNIQQFKRDPMSMPMGMSAQVAPDQMLEQQAQAGNVIPISSAMMQGGGGVMEPGQVGGVGPTA